MFVLCTINGRAASQTCVGSTVKRYIRWSRRRLIGVDVTCDQGAVEPLADHGDGIDPFRRLHEFGVKTPPVAVNTAGGAPEL